MQVTFWGVRGSCPCPNESYRKYGGNTACVVLEQDGEAPIIFDLGTGLRPFGETQPTDGTFRGSAFITHMHWDHVQGLPFFPPADRVGARLDVYGPTSDGEALGAAFDGLVRPPYFPVRLAELRGQINFYDVATADLTIGKAMVKVRPVPHVGMTIGYRVTADGVSVAYISDHQAPLDLDTIAPEVLELVEGADLLIHDSQYTEAEFAEKSHWGHCTIDYALKVARRGRVKRVALFHHDPGHDDLTMDRLAEELQGGCGEAEPEVLVAREGLSLRI